MTPSRPSLELPLPELFDPHNARSWSYTPDQQSLLAAASRWRAEHHIPSAGTDTVRIRLLLIDLQKDFCLPQGSLFVGGRSGVGAVEDNQRLARFIYRNLAHLTDITCTMDTHHPFQIFFPSFWVDGAGAHPRPHRVVTTQDIRQGELRPDPELASWLCEGDAEWLERQVEFYCDELERRGKYTLYLWPPHCILGSDGHALSGIVHEARMFHAFSRKSRNGTEVKGDHPLTENYSVLAPEVLARHDGGALAQRNTVLLETLLGSEAVVIAGQAASHCVKSSLEDLLEQVRTQDPRLAERIFILRDCTSAVAIPDPEREGEFLADFTPEAEEALAGFAKAGMHLVDSTVPMSRWPGPALQ